MREYHKITTALKRDPTTNYKTLLREFAKPEFEYLRFLQWVGTEKIDGTNIRVMWDGATVSFGGKTDNAQMPAPLVKHLQATFTPERMAAQFGAEGGVCLYGEGYGGSIQKGSYYRQDQAFILFDVHIGEVWLERMNVHDIGEKLSIPVVPIVFTGTLDDGLVFVEGFINSSEGPAFRAPVGKREGLVLRPSCELRNRFGERVITKIKVKDFAVQT